MLVSACGNGGNSNQVAVVPQSVWISADRRTVTVQTSYPTSLPCAKQPAGLDVEVDGGDAVVTALMARSGDGGSCTMECAGISQSVTLDEPLPLDVRLVAPAGADPGCAGGLPVITTTTLSPGAT
jgi:hypothetical protein